MRPFKIFDFKDIGLTYKPVNKGRILKNLPAMQETWVQCLDWKILWRREWQPTPVFLPGVLHGQKSLEGYTP